MIGQEFVPLDEALSGRGQQGVALLETLGAL